MNQSIAQIIAYVNSVITTNGANAITGGENNQALVNLATAVLNYTVNGQSAVISTSTGVVALSKPVTLFSVAAASISWTDNFSLEYYIINATSSNIPISVGFSFVDQFGTTQTAIPARTAIHIAKAANGSWIQVNNLGGGGSGTLPPFTGHAGQSLFNDGTGAMWGNNVLPIYANDANWESATQWVNGHGYEVTSFPSSKFLVFWNDASRFLLPTEFGFVTNGLNITLGGFNSASANIFLFFTGEN